MPHYRNNSKTNIEIVGDDKIDTPNTQIYYLSLSWLDTGTSIKSGGVKLVLWAQAMQYKAEYHPEN